ncbi:MAG: Dps family protein [Alphaproteobacteria bacterium]
MLVDIGIPKKERKLVADDLSRLLADTFILALKTHNYHWNVTGPYFKVLHNLFEEVYTELIEAGDEIAERVRALGFYAPGSYHVFAQLAVVEEERNVPPAMDMVRQLVKDNELMVRRAGEVGSIAGSVGDLATVDAMIRRQHVHSHCAWMLRSHLEG